MHRSHYSAAASHLLLVIFLGIDPGMSGAVARFDDEAHKVTVARDFRSQATLAKAVWDLSDGVQCAAVELVASRPGQGAQSIFTFGRATGIAQAPLYIRGIQFIEPTPQRWMSYFGQPYKAFDSRQIAMEWFPDQKHLFRRMLDHNTADAVLIAAWLSAEWRRTRGIPLTSRKKQRAIVDAKVINVPRDAIAPAPLSPADTSPQNAR